VISYTYPRTYATTALEKGVGIAQVAELLGHVDTKMVLQHYSMLSQGCGTCGDGGEGGVGTTGRRTPVDGNGKTPARCDAGGGREVFRPTRGTR